MNSNMLTIRALMAVVCATDLTDTEKQGLADGVLDSNGYSTQSDTGFFEDLAEPVVRPGEAARA